MKALPADWTLMPLGNLTQPTRKRVKPSTLPNHPYVGMENVEAHSMRLLGTVPASTMRSTAVHFKEGDVLYGRLRPYLNKVLLAEFEGLASPEFIAMPPNPTIRGRYLQYFLNHSGFVRFAVGLNTGDRPRVDFDQLKGFPVPVPPLLMQDAIVEEIEKQFSRLDAAEIALRRARVNLNRFWTSLLQSSLDRVESAGGKRQTLHSLAATDRKIAYGVLQPGPHVDGGTPLVRVQDIKGERLELHDGIKRIAPEVANKYPRTVLRGGELLLTIVGTIGRVTVAGSTLKGANVARAVAVLPMADTVDSLFLMHVLASPRSAAQLNRSSHEVARKTLNLEDVREFTVLVPDQGTQSTLALRFEALGSVVNPLRTQLLQNETRALKVRSAILSNAFSGRLVKAPV